ncbi:OmpW family protein [Trinickia terrae]|uniref:OmpW family protein n=1 Tax=Trinickia terrae TaxID=2571161 RepID=A0A4U1I346_9BURK|nr:OmpW family outer membrane protein [Trinickia terrae]TKC87644.1 OmpW family protein [Trinickia terrae]
MQNWWKIVAVLGLASAASGVAKAQSAGSNIIGLGWVELQPINGGSTPQVMTSLDGAPTHQEAPGTIVKPKRGGTLAINFEHYFTDHISLYVLGGIPGHLKVEGSAMLARYGEVGGARVISPQVNLRYHFCEPQTKFRPFVGLGVNYTTFYNEQITNNRYVADSLGPGGSASIKASSSWNPVFEVGADYLISKSWSIGLAVGYMPVKTTFTTHGSTAAGDQIVTQSKLDLNPLTATLTVKYSF